MESKTYGTIRYKGQFLKVIKVSTSGGKDWILQCRDLDSKHDQTPTLNLSGFLEALDKALPAMKTPKGIFFLDFDNQGQLKVVNGETTCGLFK